MRKVICLLVVGLLLAPVMGFATETRVKTMGDVNHIVKDDANVTMFPQTLHYYGDQMIVGVNEDGELSNFGAAYKIGPGTLGLYFYADDLENEYLPGISRWDDTTASSLNHKLTALWAQEMGDILLGFGLTIYGNSHTVDSTDDKSVQKGMGLGIQAGATIMDNLEAGFEFRTTSFTHEGADGKTITEPDGNTLISLGARYWIEQSDIYTMVPYFHFEMEGIGRSTDEGKSGNTDKTTVIALGLGNNINASDNVMVVSDFGIMLISGALEETDDGTSVETTFKMREVPYFRVGLEAEVFSWMDLRLGAQRTWNSFSYEDPDKNSESWGGADTDLYLGAGFHWGNMDIDAWIDPGFVTRGPYLVSGESGNLAMQASVKYYWGE